MWGGGEIHEKNNIEGEIAGKGGGALTFYRFKGGELSKKEGVMFLKGVWFPSAHYALLSVLHKNFIVKPQSPILISSDINSI